MKRTGGRRRATARTLAAAPCLLALASIALGCGQPADDASQSVATSEAPPAPRGCDLDEPIALPGEPVALAAGALVVRGEGGLHLHRVDDPQRAVALDVESVARRGLVARATSVLALAGTVEGPALLVIEAEEIHRVPLARGGLGEGALAAHGGTATAAWLDAGGALRVARVDLTSRRASEPETVASVDDGAPLIACTSSGAVVSWTARGASLVTVADGSITRERAPGLPLALLDGSTNAGVLYEAADRTGAWLSSAGSPAVRVTHPEARPASPSIAPLLDGSVVAYREGPDVLLQRLGEDAIPRGGPVVAGSSGPGGPQRPLFLASDGARAWIAWQGTSDGAPRAHVRSARCR